MSSESKEVQAQQVFTAALACIGTAGGLSMVAHAGHGRSCQCGLNELVVAAQSIANGVLRTYDAGEQDAGEVLARAVEEYLYEDVDATSLSTALVDYQQKRGQR